MLRQWPGGLAVGSRPVGRMGLQRAARVRGVRCVCCVSPTFLRLRRVARWAVVSMSTRGPCGVCGLVGRVASVRVRDALLTRVSRRVCSPVRALVACGLLWALVVGLALHLVSGAGRVPAVS